MVSEKLDKYVRQISPGDCPYLPTLNDDEGRPTEFDSDYLSGRPLVLIFIPSLNDEAVLLELEAFLSASKGLDEAKAHTLLITAETDSQKNHALKQKIGLPWPVLTDPGGATFAAYGLSKTKKCLRTVVLSSFRQIQAVLDMPEVTNHANKVLSVVRNGKPLQNSAWAPPHAPVLIIPKVLNRRECGDLLKLFKTRGELTVTSPEPSHLLTDYKIPVYDYDRQDRVDHVIINSNVNHFLEGRMRDRVYPVIKKAFSFEVTQHEPFHIARYTGPRKGTHVGHRDNTAPETKYRRFALSLSLNDDYEAGELVFREFTDKGYRGNSGTAFVFSSSLLHEILETTHGIRFTLISHFF